MSIISIDQKLVFHIQLQSLVVSLDLSDGVFLSKVEKQLWWSISLFQTILSPKFIR
jgi:hypothetical protein